MDDDPLMSEESLDDRPICPGCGWPMEWSGDEQEIELEGGQVVVYEPIYRCINPNCGFEEDE